MTKPVTVDFETQGIEARPEYPPVPVGLAILRPGKKPEYHAWGHPTNNNCDKSKAAKILKDLWKSGADLLMHNAKFDLDVAEAHFGLALPAWDRIHDTLYTLFLLDPHAVSLGLKPSAEKHLGLPPDEQDAVKEWLVAHKVIAANQNHGAHIAQAPGDLVGKYAIGDVVRTLKLHEKLYPKLDKRMRVAYDRERRLMPILLANEREGLRFDVARAERDIPIYEEAMNAAEAWLRKRLKVKEINFDADAEVGEALARAKIVTEFTMTKTGKRSVAKKNMGVDKFHDLEVFRILGYRNRLQTVLALNLRPWLATAQENDGMIYTEWNQVRGEKGGARTGRVSCSRLMNVSKDFSDKGDGYEHPKMIKVPELPLVRRYLLPDKGQLFGHVDYRQQEYRITAHFENGALLKSYIENPSIDYHTMMQQRVKEIAGKSYERRLIKIINFAILYGTGTALLAEMAHIDMATAKELKEAVKAAAPDVIELNNALMQRGREGKPIRTWGGRVYYCEEPRWSDKYKRAMSFEYKLLNYLVQGSAADCTKEAIIRYHDMKRDARMLVTVHDEVNISCPKGAERTEIRKLQDAMESIEFDVPMLTDAEVGPSWGELHALQGSQEAKGVLPPALASQEKRSA